MRSRGPIRYSSLWRPLVQGSIVLVFLALLTGCPDLLTRAFLDSVSCATVSGWSNGVAFSQTELTSADDLRLAITGDAVTPLADRDGDGAPDVADDFPDDGALTGMEDGLLVVLDPATSSLETLSRDFSWDRADVYFLTDSSASMADEVSALGASLTSGTYLSGCPGGILGAIDCLVPDPRYGAGRFSDFPVAPYGSDLPACDDVAFEHLVGVTDFASSVDSAVDGLSVACGGDAPTSGAVALHQLVTGTGLPPYVAAGASCPDGSWGIGCFRDDALPIIVLLTNALLHEGPSGQNYDPAILSVSPPSWATTVSALLASDATILTVESSGVAMVRNEMETLANVTGSTDSSGVPYVSSVPVDGSGLAAAIVNDLVDVVNFRRADIGIVVLDEPSTSFDESTLVDSADVISWGPGSCLGISGGTGVQCLPGTTVGFSLEVTSVPVTPDITPTVIDFEAAVTFDGMVGERIPLRLVVPAVAPVYAATGNARVDASCPTGATWSELAYDVDLPAGTGLRFHVSFAADLASLDAATPLALPTPTAGSGTLDLRAAAGGDDFPAIRLVAELQSSPDQRRTPLLRSFEVRAR